MTDVYTQQQAADNGEEVGRLRRALLHISGQKTSDELLAEYGEEFVGDFEFAYDQVVLFAREYVK